MRTYAQLPKSPTAAVVVSFQMYEGRPRVDIREALRRKDAPPRFTARGAGVPLAELPRLRDALEQIERDALCAGLLTAAEYQAAGLTPPTITAP
jgi:hypothetical protein